MILCITSRYHANLHRSLHKSPHCRVWLGYLTKFDRRSLECRSIKTGELPTRSDKRVVSSSNSIIEKLLQVHRKQMNVINFCSNNPDDVIYIIIQYVSKYLTWSRNHYELFVLKIIKLYYYAYFSFVLLFRI